MLLQDNARKFEHNERVKAKRVAALQETGAFRAPLPEATSKFKRGFQPTYGDVKQVRSIRGSTVTAQDGSKIDVKRVKIVPAESSTAAQAASGKTPWAQNASGRLRGPSSCTCRSSWTGARAR